MTVDEVKKYFKTGYGLWKATGFSHNSYNYWDKVGYVPTLAQLKLEQITNGDLKADKEDFHELKKPNKAPKNRINPSER